MLTGPPYMINFSRTWLKTLLLLSLQIHTDYMDSHLYLCAHWVLDLIREKQHVSCLQVGRELEFCKFKPSTEIHMFACIHLGTYRLSYSLIWWSTNIQRSFLLSAPRCCFSLFSLRIAHLGPFSITAIFVFRSSKENSFLTVRCRWVMQLPLIPRKVIHHPPAEWLTDYFPNAFAKITSLLSVLTPKL